MSKKALLAGLAPFLTNPATIAVAAVGLVGWTIYDLCKDQEEPEKTPTAPHIGDQRPKAPSRTVKPTDRWTALEPLNTVRPTGEETVETTVEPPLNPVTEMSWDQPIETVPTEEEEAAQKKELIRQAMSELGKRSAAKRLKKNRTI